MSCEYRRGDEMGRVFRVGLNVRVWDRDGLLGWRKVSREVGG